MAEETQQERLTALLDQTHDWPAVYHFKFIVPTPQVAALTALLPAGQVTLKASANGTYTSVTAGVLMPSAAVVLAVYARVAVVEGLVSL